MSSSNYNFIGFLFLGSFLLLFILIVRRLLVENSNWIPALISGMSLLVFWLACGMPGMKFMAGYPFLITYMLAIMSLVGIPVLACIDILVILLRRNIITIWPYHLLALILAGLSMGMVLIRHSFDNTNF